MEPAYYHVEGGTGVKYRGDRHPISACDERFGTVFDPEVFEENEREYKNCGKAVLCFHKKYCRASKVLERNGEVSSPAFAWK